MDTANLELSFGFVAAFLVGCFIVFPALAIENAFSFFAGGTALLIVSVAFEELLKLSAFFALAVAFNESRCIEGTLLAGLVALGYGLGETIIVIASALFEPSISLIVFRASATVPVHVLSTAVAAFLFLRTRRFPALLAGFSIGFLLHLLFNLVLIS